MQKAPYRNPEITHVINTKEPYLKMIQRKVGDKKVKGELRGSPF
jgi:hypothetical protein